MQQLSRRERLRRSLELPKISIVKEKKTTLPDGFTKWNEPSPRPEALTQVELMPVEIRAWDDTFRAWTLSCCEFRECSWGIVSALYISQTAWAHETGNPFVGERETFVVILQSLGFSIAPDESVVYGLLLKDDVKAVEAVRRISS